jgi:uncharacterized Zn-binding protein involved in type VI secretion
MPEAARLGDPIGHSPTMSWLLKGLLIGAGIALVGVAIVGTGGLAAAAIVGGMAAAGAGIGEVMSTMSFAPKEVVGKIIEGSRNVYIRGKKAARAHVDHAECGKHPQPPKVIATGSGNVYINGMPAARVGDKTECGAEITAGAGNVFIGGGTQQTDAISPENLVPGWVHAALLVVGVGSAVILGGPLLAIGGLVGGVAGGFGGDWLGGELFGEGSDGQKWMMLGGSILGGWWGAKGAARLGRPTDVDPIVLRQNQNEQLRNSARFAEDKAKVGVTEEQIARMQAKEAPLGFKDEQQFGAFKQDLQQALGKSGLDDAEVGMKGTATTFYSENPGKPLGHHWDADPLNPGDYDLNLFSSKMNSQLQEAGAMVHEKYDIYRTKDITNNFPELANFMESWSNNLGREVNIVGLPKAPVRDATEFILFP